MKPVTRNCAFCGKKVVRKSPGKKNSFCDLDCKAAYQRLAKPVTKEWLIQKYTNEMLTANEIAVLVDRDPKSVWNWLKDFDIPTRPRGSYERNHFPKGHTSMLGKHHTKETREKIRQARLIDGHVPYLQNGVHHLKGKRGADTPNWKGGITPERASFYGSTEWKKASRSVWIRDESTCQRCGRKATTQDKRNHQFDIHHIISFENVELRAELSNLVLLCEKCHYWVHSNQNSEKEFLR